MCSSDLGGGHAKVIAGRLTTAGLVTAGVITGITTDVLYIDVELPSGAEFTQALAEDYTAFLYGYEGHLVVGAASGERALPAHAAGVLSTGGEIRVVARNGAARFLLLAGKPLREPIVQYGPFVMNTQAEIHQAFADYRRTEFGGWPWASSDPVHPRNTGRFAKHADGRVEHADTTTGAHS